MSFSWPWVGSNALACSRNISKNIFRKLCEMGYMVDHHLQFSKFVNVLKHCSDYNGLPPSRLQPCQCGSACSDRSSKSLFRVGPGAARSNRPHPVQRGQEDHLQAGLVEAQTAWPSQGMSHILYYERSSSLARSTATTATGWGPGYKKEAKVVSTESSICSTYKKLVCMPTFA